MRSIKLIRGGRFRPHGKASHPVKPFGDQITCPHPPLEFPFCPYVARFVKCAQLLADIRIENTPIEIFVKPVVELAIIERVALVFYRVVPRRKVEVNMDADILAVN